jgi:hypothetical protein
MKLFLRRKTQLDRIHSKNSRKKNFSQNFSNQRFGSKDFQKNQSYEDNSDFYSLVKKTFFFIDFFFQKNFFSFEKIFHGRKIHEKYLHPEISKLKRLLISEDS